ncbi:WD40/YVTN repeat-like-containing domain superfamily [Sesbania bispinosa]|nr:WD40/YVTN repeat-like-containing domain superfamily [Sesbania bispinosa]
MEHLDFDVVKSVNPEFKQATVRINIYKHHRQTIQYILPHEHEKLSQVELLVVDEAAAIPLPVVKCLLGPYLVFLSSTVNGYEGTGRSLSLKLLQQLEKQSHVSAKSTEDIGSGHLFKKIELSESIRYASGDPIESWLNTLLCLNVSNAIPNLSSRLPQPSECDLYYVNRDTLFSYHRDSELFLQRMMTLYVASHYKNSPNDLQLMADAPAHHLFVLLGPVDESKNQLPDILCVLQVCLEGQISHQSAIQSLSNGHRPFGDQIPWKFCEQFRDTVFPSLSGARIVRIAAHPSLMRCGYGSRAVELLIHYYEGQLTPISEMNVEDEVQAPQVRVTEAAEKMLGKDSLDFWLPLFVAWNTSLLWGQEPMRTASNNFSESVGEYLSPHDMKRLEAYVSNSADFHLILDLVPILAHLYFQEKLPVTLSYVQASVLLCIGLQNQNISYIEGQMSLERQQILSQFIKIMKKFYGYLNGLASKKIESTLPQQREIVLEPHNVSLDEDLNNAAKQVEDDMKSKAEVPIPPELLQQYAIEDGKILSDGLISVKSSRNGAKPEKENISHKRGVAPSEEHPENIMEGFTETQVTTMAVWDNLLIVGGNDRELIVKRIDQPGCMASNQKGSVKVFDTEKFELLDDFLFLWPVNSASLSPDGRQLVVVGDNPEGKLLDYETGNPIALLSGQSSERFFSSAWHPDGYIFATGDQDRTCYIWDVRNMSKSVVVLNGNVGAEGIHSIRFTSDGELMAMAEGRNCVHLYDVKSGFEKEKEQEMEFSGYISGLSVSPDAESLFIGVALDNSNPSVLLFNRCRM